MANTANCEEPTNVGFAALRYVSLRLLWDCNLHCIMCDHPHRPKDEMPVEIAEQVLNQLTHKVRVTFIGGEPCLWLMRFPHVLRRAIADGHGVHLITNGILLSKVPDFVNAFRDKPVSVQFSIDGYRRSYELVRKRSSWDAVVNGIRLIQAKKREGQNAQAIITVNYLLMRQTLEDLPRFVEFCASEGIDAISLTYAIMIESMVARGDIENYDSVYYHKQRTIEVIDVATEVARKHGISISIPPRLGDANAFGKTWIGAEVASYAPGNSPLPRNIKLSCAKPWKEIYVNQDGTVVPCCCGPTIGPAIGNISEGLEKIWNNREIKQVRQALIEGEFHDNCRCGINISAVGRQDGPDRFFTQLQSSRATATQT